VHSAGGTVDLRRLSAGSELVLLVFEQDVERGERSVTARDILLQVDLVRFAQFVARVHLLGDRATKNFRGHIRARDQKHSLGIGVSGWGLKERRRCRRTGSFRNDMLLE